MYGGQSSKVGFFSETYKACVHNGMQPSLFHYREARGPEIDLLIENGEDLAATEIKSGATIPGDYAKNLKRFAERMKTARKARKIRRYLVYGGEESQKRSDVQVLSWQDCSKGVMTLKGLIFKFGFSCGDPGVQRTD
jgi:hypothetical protein